MWNHMWGWDGGWGMGWGLYGLMQVLWLVLLVFGIVALFRGLTGRPRHGGRGDSALQILRERYARGEIDEAEYAARRKQLKA